MAWSYTKPTGNTGTQEGRYILTWVNHWTAQQISGAPSGSIRLKIEFHTDSYYVTGGFYTFYSSFTVSCGGDTVEIQPREPDTAHLQFYDGNNGQQARIIDVPASWNGQTVTFYMAFGTFTTTLDAIPTDKARPSAADGVFGGTVAVELNGAETGSGFTPSYVVKVSCAGLEETITDGGTAALVYWKPDLERYAQALPDTDSAEAEISCETCYGDTKYEAERCTITMRFAPGSLPPETEAGWVTAEPLNTGLPAAFAGIYIEGKSRAKLRFDTGRINCRYGAQVSSVSFTCNEASGEEEPGQRASLELDTDVLPGTSAEIVCTVTDTRGQTASQRLFVTLQSYRAPTLSGISLFRCDSSGEEDENGTYFYAKATAGFSSLKDAGGTERNSVTLVLSSVESGGSAGPGAQLISGTGSVVGGFDPDAAYALTITAMDGLGSAETYAARFPTRFWAMKFRENGNGLAFGRAPAYQVNRQDAPALELGNGWPLVLYDDNGNSAALDKATLDRLLALLT